LSWSAPTTNTDGTQLKDLAGYKAYYGTASRTYSQVVDVGNVTTRQINNLTDGLTYYFAVTAYDTLKNESVYSNEVSKTFTTSVQQFALTINKSGTGTGTVTAGSGINCGTVCTASYNNGTVVTLTAAPATGSTFTGWSGDGCTGTGQCAITMNATHTIQASFSSTYATTYTITASGGTGGSISPSGSVSVNRRGSQTFTITPNTGYSISDVKVDNASVGAVSSYTFSNVTAAHTIQASFSTLSNISFVQVAAATPQSSQAVAVTYPRTQTAGNLNIIVVGWNDTTASVQSVRDSAGNAYSLAIGPTGGTALRQSIYYTKNIKGGSTTVTVTFSQAAYYPDIRILEYAGVSTLDKTAGASGNSSTANSGSVTTTAAKELIFGANTVYTRTSSVGTNFTSRIITQDGDIAEDRIVSATGTYSATTPLTSAGPWVMQMATFK
jgi:hypothetical protein